MLKGGVFFKKGRAETRTDNEVPGNVLAKLQYVIKMSISQWKNREIADEETKTRNHSIWEGFVGSEYRMYLTCVQMNKGTGEMFHPFHS